MKHKQNTKTGESLSTSMLNWSKDALMPDSVKQIKKNQAKTKANIKKETGK